VSALFASPARLVTVAFALAVTCGTALLMLPVSRTDPGAGDLMVASFTTVSAVCVTGLITVDTPTYWTPFGQSVILVLIHIGGVGVMTLATLLTLTVRGRLGLRSRMVAQAETHTTALGDVRRVLGRVVAMMLLIELCVAVVLVLRFRFGYDQDWTAARVTSAMQRGTDANKIFIKNRIPVYLTYFTAVMGEDGEMKQYKDLYGHDRRMVAVTHTAHRENGKEPVRRGFTGRDGQRLG